MAFFDQTFVLSDIPRVFILVFLEMLLSLDNAIILGVLIHSLPEQKRRKALFIGVFSALFLRLGALLTINTILKWTWIQVLAGLYLILLAGRHFLGKKRQFQFHPLYTFWKVVVLIETFDLVFAIDSIVAGLAFIDGVYSQIWIVYLGGILGLVAMRYVADWFSHLMKYFPHIERSGFLIVAWVGIKLFLLPVYSPFSPLLFWSVVIALFLLGFYRPKKVN